MRHHQALVHVHKSLLVVLAAILLAINFGGAARLGAQISVSSLTGSVSDSTGAAIPNATLKITSTATGASRVVGTMASGTYAVADLTPGQYRVEVQAHGFKTAFLSEITLYVGQTSAQNFRLDVGAETQSVTVTGEVPLLNTTSGELGTVVTGTLMTELPLNGRNFMQLNLLSPGAITDKSGNTSSSVDLNPASVTFSVNGHMSDYNLYLLDGVEIKDWQHGTSMFSPSVDAVQEFQTTTGNYSAAFGAESAAQINLVIKAGSNKPHATLWEFVRNDLFDAKNYFQPAGTPQPFRRNQFGANFGGPVFFPRLYNGRDKTFFFFNYEGFRQVKQIPQTSYLPTPTELQGNLSDLTTPQAPLINPFTGQSFPNNTIPSNMIRPSTLEGFLSNGIGTGPWIPAPNTNLPGINYINVSPLSYFSNQYIARGDQIFTNKSSAYVHYAYSTAARHDPNNLPVWYNTEDSQTSSVAGHFVHIFNDRILLDVGAGYTHFYQDEVQSTAGKNDITNSILGIKGNSTVPAAWGAPVWDVAGYGDIGETSTGPRLWFINLVDLRPALALTQGKHSLHIGMDFQRVNEDFQEIYQTNGTWNYDGSFSGYALGDFLLGLPNSIFSSPDPFSPDFFNSTIGPYLQDDWRLTRRLTLNLGLRYEWVGIPLSHNHRSVSNIFFPKDGSDPQLVVADDASAITFEGTQATLFTGVPFVRASTVGLPEPLAFNDFDDYSPRIGFAYQLPGLVSTVLRGGYGVFYAENIQDNWVEAAVDAPFVRSNLTTLDSTNFESFDPINPYTDTVSSAAQIFGNQINHHMGRTQEWNLTLESTKWNTLFSLGYVGNRATHLPDLEDPNQAVPGPGAIAARRRWPDQGALIIAGENAYANYNGLQAKVQRNYSNGFEFIGSYTWSRTLNTSDGTYVGEGGHGGDTQNLIDPQTEYGLAAQHVGQRFSLSGVYELPFGRGKRMLNDGLASLVLGGWQINGITSVSSGSPFTLSQATDGANTDAGNFSPNIVGVPRLSHPSVQEFFNIAAFVENDPVNGVYSFGNAGRNTVIGPRSVDTDFSLYKNFGFGDERQLQFRAEGFNVFNHPIFAQPGSVLGTPSFGTLTSTAIDERELQLALRLSF
jgi:hypothetical protein